MKPQLYDSSVRYHSVDQPKLPLWAVIGIFAALAVLVVILFHHL